MELLWTSYGFSTKISTWDSVVEIRLHSSKLSRRILSKVDWAFKVLHCRVADVKIEKWNRVSQSVSWESWYLENWNSPLYLSQNWQCYCNCPVSSCFLVSSFPTLYYKLGNWKQITIQSWKTGNWKFENRNWKTGNKLQCNVGKLENWKQITL